MTWELVGGRVIDAGGAGAAVERLRYVVVPDTSAAGHLRWVQQTMREHIDDKRDFLYTLEELENCQTHD